MLGILVHRLRVLFWTAFYHSIGRFAFRGNRLGFEVRGLDRHPAARRKDSRRRDGANRASRGIHGDPRRRARGRPRCLHRSRYRGERHRRVSIGARTLLAEYVSIHDNDHGISRNVLPIERQGFTAQPLEIGSDCWVGAHATLVRGAALGARCVVGAGAVVTGSIREAAVVAGVPSREIRPGIAPTPASQSVGAGSQDASLEGRI